MAWPKKTPKNIIVRMPNWLGDLVMATPVLADLRARFPEATITAMAQSNVAGMLKHDPHINELYSYKRPSGWLHRHQHGEIIHNLQHGEYDLGILLTNSFSSAWWFWRGHVKNRLGFADHFRSLLLNRAVPFPEERKTQHLVKTYKMLLAPLGIPLSASCPTLYISPEEQEAAKNLLLQLGVPPGATLIGINPGAAYGSAKCWLPDRFRAVTKQLLQDPNHFVVYFGDPAGAPLVNDICKDLPERVINLAGKTNLRELLALVQRCAVFLTNDSGPMHIAAALGTPLLALFGSTDDVQTGPFNLIGKVIHKRVECSPCYKRVCPIDFRCMKRIESDEVYLELKELINHHGEARLFKI